jgi:hypothetical protein
MNIATQVSGGQILLDDESTGWCPRCGEAPSFSWTWAENATGYVDACHVCVQGGAMNEPSKPRKWWVWLSGEGDRRVKITAPTEEAARQKTALRRRCSPMEVYVEEAKPMEEQRCPKCGWTFLGRGYGGAHGNERNCSLCKAETREARCRRAYHAASEALRVAKLKRAAQAARRRTP